MKLEVEDVYNKALSAVALIGFMAFVLLSIRSGEFSPMPVYGAIVFAVIMFAGYFLTNSLLYGQDPAFFTLACFISELGLIMLYRIDPDIFVKQLVWFAIGVVAFLVTSLLSKLFIDVKINPYILWAITFLLLLAPLIFGVERRGSRSWIQVGQHLFQPSELAKLTFVLFLAGYMRNKTIENLWLLGSQIISCIGLLALAKDLGGAMLFYLTALVIVFVATSRWDLTGLSIGAMGIASILGYYIFDHVKVRVAAWLNPWEDVPGKGYQIVQSLFAIAEGGFFGTGLGLGHPEYIPAVTTDFIFSAFTEEFGLLGACAIIFLYFLLIYRGIKVALYSREQALALSALGITAMFGLQIFTIIGGVIKLIPLTGVTLPFMSYGGSSMVMSFISLGILNGIWLKVKEAEENE